MLIVVLFFVSIAGLGIMVYFMSKNRTDDLQDSTKKESVSSEPSNLNVEIGLWNRNDALKIAYNLFIIYKASSEKETEYYGRSKFEIVSRHLFEIKDYIGKEHIKKSNRYDDVISEYNKVTEQYKRRKERLTADLKAVSTSPDMQHCPSCLEDIGKEVTRSRKCPKCGEKILIYRAIPGDWFLVNESQNTILEKMRIAVVDYQIPNILDAFYYSKELATEFERMVNEYIDEEAKKKKAKELTIDF